MCVAILIDATIIRAVVLPAAMALLGERTWYLPKFLSWVPELSHGDSAPAPRETVPGGPGRSAEQEPAAV
jgi:uncharacterized membrane protein YdfJ with MMPL/SSD domain